MRQKKFVAFRARTHIAATMGLALPAAVTSTRALHTANYATRARRQVSTNDVAHNNAGSLQQFCTVRNVISTFLVRAAVNSGDKGSARARNNNELQRQCLAH